MGLLFLGASTTHGQSSSGAMPEDFFLELRGMLLQALDRAPDMEAENLSLEEARGNLRAALSQGLPRVRLDTRFLYQYEERLDAENDDYDQSDVVATANLQVTQPIYHWGAISASRRIGELDFDRALEDRLGVGSRVAFEVRNRYLDYLLANYRLILAQENNAVADRLVRQQEELAAAGRVAEQTVLETRLAAQRITESLVFARKDVAALEVFLSRATGVTPTPPTALPEPIELAQLSESALGRAAAGIPADNPSLSNMRLALEQEQERFRMIRAETRPKINLVAGIFQDQVDDIRTNFSIATVPRINFYAGVQVSWNIFDGWQTEGLKMASLARQRMGQARLAQEEERLAREVDRLVTEIRFSAEQQETRDRRAELLTQRLALMEEQAAQQRVALNTVLRERNEVEQARLDAIAVRFDLLRNLARLQVILTGDPLVESVPAPQGDWDRDD